MPLPTDPKIVSLAEAILSQFDQIFGLHTGFRAAHAKGIMLTGTYVPSLQAASLSKAAHFNNASTTITARFSNSTGFPALPDNDANADPRGLAVRFHLGEHSHTDIVSHSTDGFPARTGQEFLELLQALAATDPSKPSDPNNPKPIEKFLGSHPAALAFVKTPKPPPSSFAREAYFAVTAYNFTNANGASRFGRYRLLPTAGTDHLTAPEAAARGPDFLFDELKQRITKAPIVFRVQVQLAEASDVTNDATVHWPATRPVVEIGTLTLTAPVKDNAAEQKQLIFDPIPRIDGIEPSADPLLELRAAIYLLSGRRRRAAK